jgi:hypothetical protein
VVSFLLCFELCSEFCFKRSLLLTFPALVWFSKQCEVNLAELADVALTGFTTAMDSAEFAPVLWYGFAFITKPSLVVDVAPMTDGVPTHNLAFHCAFPPFVKVVPLSFDLFIAGAV